MSLNPSSDLIECRGCHHLKPRSEITTKGKYTRKRTGQVLHYYLCSPCAKIKRDAAKTGNPTWIWVQSSYRSHKRRSKPILADITVINKMALDLLGKRCPCCLRRKLVFGAFEKMVENSATIDIIDPKLPSTNDNIQVICNTCNRDKSRRNMVEWTEEEQNQVTVNSPSYTNKAAVFVDLDTALHNPEAVKAQVAEAIRKALLRRAV